MSVETSSVWSRLMLALAGVLALAGITLVLAPQTLTIICFALDLCCYCFLMAVWAWCTHRESAH